MNISASAGSFARTISPRTTPCRLHAWPMRRFLIAVQARWRTRNPWAGCPVSLIARIGLFNGVLSADGKIGRASCREGGWWLGVRGVVVKRIEIVTRQVEGGRTRER